MSDAAGPGGGRFTGRVVLITGASRGIGAAAARRFAAEGATVMLAHQPSAEMTDLAAVLGDELRAGGGDAATAPADLADPHAPAALVATTLERFGRLDVIVANAAHSAAGSFDEIPDAEWDAVLDTNLRSPWQLVKAAAGELRQRRGAVIVVSSIMAVTGTPAAAHYTASKAGLLGLTRALARELGPDEVRVNAIMPGAIRTEHEVELWPDAATIDPDVIATQALRRRGVAADLAGAFAFLASEDAAFITGQVLCVDGGTVFY